jgi:hypothetical protein
MPVAIKNLSSRPIYVPLNSGANLRLSPGEIAENVHDVELKDNSKIEKLRNQRIIAVADAQAEVAGAAEPPKPAETDASGQVVEAEKPSTENKS